jgi:hypothetical protein
MLRFRPRRARRDDPLRKPASHGFTPVELQAWLDAICALQIFRLNTGKGDA